MANRVRGIRQRLPSNVLLGRLNGAGGPAQALSLTAIANAIIQGGAIPLPGGGGFITAVDSNFTVTGGTLSLHTIAAGDLIGNSTGSTAEPTATTLTALLDQAVGNTKGDVLYRDTSVWQVLAPGSDTQVLTLASGIPSWAAASGGTTLNPRGAWGGTAAYNPGDVVTYNGSAYLNYAAITSPPASIVVDGVATGANLGSSSGTITAVTGNLNTSNSNDIIVVFVGALAGSGSWPTISVSDTAGLTWTQYDTFTNPLINARYSVFWALASSPLVNDVITATVDHNSWIDVTAVGVAGAGSLVAPFDTNVSLPVDATPGPGSGGGGPPAVTGVSTSNSTTDALVFFMEATNTNGVLFNTSLTGFTNLSSITGGVGGNSFAQAIFYQHIATPLSSATITSPDTTYFFWGAQGSAIDGGAVLLNTSPDLDDTHWLSQGSDTLVTTVSGLSAASIPGRRAFVTDALTPTFGSPVVGGGAVGVPVYDDGSNWNVG